MHTAWSTTSSWDQTCPTLDNSCDGSRIRQETGILHLRSLEKYYPIAKSTGPQSSFFPLKCFVGAFRLHKTKCAQLFSYMNPFCGVQLALGIHRVSVPGTPTFPQVPKSTRGDFFVGPVAETLHYQCRGSRVRSLGQRTRPHILQFKKEPTCHKEDQRYHTP